MNFFFDRNTFKGDLASRDVYFSRWSSLLYMLVALASLLTVALPIQYLIRVGRIVLLHDAKLQEFLVWSLPSFELSVVLFGMFTPRIVWLYGLLQFSRMARYFRQGRIFEERNARCLVRVGYALGIICVMDSVFLPSVAFAFYWGGTTPWLADLPIAHIIEPDYAMAGLLFLVLGKVMHRAVEIEKESRLIV